MTYVSRHRINATVTSTGGAAQVFYTPVINGYLEAIVYKRGTTGTTASGISTNAHFTVTAGESSNVLLSCTATDARAFYPRMNLESTAGATVAGFGRFPIAQERIKVEVTSGGTASNGGVRGVFDFYVESGN